MKTEDLETVMTMNLTDMAKFSGVVESDVPFGYTVINEVLVSDSFKRRLKLHLSSIVLEYGTVISVRKLCGEKFLNSLTAEERHVLAPCILLLINEAKITMHFPGEEQGDSIKPARTDGYTLSTECIVPEALLDLLHKSLAKAWFEYDRVLAPRKALGDETWNALTNKDQELLGHCLLVKLSDDRVHLYPLDLFWL